ncbi:MAG: hypothetical protein P4L31_00370, partial [Candidatus Babeliales bacterium]|nr:hypothetical protein [Candidatus Babeliales bacterium]
MKLGLKICFGILPIFGASGLFAAAGVSLPVTPYYSIRPQGVDAARELSGWAHQVNLADKDGVYGSLSLTTEYAQSFKSSDIAQSLFGVNSCATNCADVVIDVSGSQAPNRGAHDWLADNFYLPTDFQSTLNFKPRIANVVVDLDFYLGFDMVCQGLFFRLNMPINWTRWDLGFCEKIVSPGVNNDDPGYFNSYDVMPSAPGAPVEGIGIERSKLLNSFGEFARGKAPQDVSNLDSITNDSAIFDPLCYAKIDCGARSVTRLADVTAILGWNFIEREKGHLGVGLLTRAPSGNRPNGEFLFEPISGNGKHWELGAHITSHATVWQAQDEHSSLGFYVDANITHLFKTRQTRTFDLKCKQLSRYMLAQKFSSPVVDLAGGTVSGTTIPVAQFANEFSPIANLTTQKGKVSVAVQADIAAQFTYANGGFNWDLGYNFWAQSCQKVSVDNDCCVTSTLCRSCPSSCDNGCSNVEFAPSIWGIKGDAYVYGFALISDTPDAIPLSATESEATINAGTNFPSGFTQAGRLNPGVDNAQLAWAG